MKLPEKKFREIKKYIKSQDIKPTKQRLIRATIIKNQKILCEYDFVLKRLLSRREAKSRDVLSKTYNRLLGSEKCKYHSCNRKIDLEKCPYCGKYFCPKHLRAKPSGMPRFKSTSVEDRLFMEEFHKPGGHPCVHYYDHWKEEHGKEQKVWSETLDRLKHPGPFKREFEAPEPKQKGLVGSVKNIPWHIKKWLNHTKYPYNRLSKKFSFNSTIFILSLAVMFLIYHYLDALNTPLIPLIKIGSILLLVAFYLTLSFGYKTFSDIFRFGRRLKNGYKLLILIVILLLILAIYQSQTLDIEKASEKVKSFDYDIFNPLDIELGSLVEGVRPGFNSKTYKTELLVFNEVNEVRGENGFNELIWDPLLADVARQHSLDMANQSYLAHESLAGKSPTERAEERGVEIVKPVGMFLQVGIGENIGEMPTGNVEGYGYVFSAEDIASAMISSWMSSPGHKENILNPRYDFIGVGVAHDGYGTYYLTQDFQ